MQTQRELNVAKFKNNAMEADGFDLVCDIIKHDERLTVERCGEGTKADFVVHMADDRAHAIGVQLKTTAKPILYAKTCWRYGFSDTDGYAGLLLLCIAMDDTKRLWLMLGSDVGNTTSIKIPVKRQSERRIGWTDHEIHPMDLGDKLVRFLTCPVDKVAICHTSSFMRPTSEKGQAEYEAFQQLKVALPLDYQPARVEGSHYDCTVHGSKWQLKLAKKLNEKTNRYTATAQKSVGRLSGIKRKLQYSEEDFEWLLIQLPAAVAYLIPMRILVARRLAGRTDCSNASIHIYVNPASWRNEWIEDYKIDLATPTVALKDYERIQAAEQAAVAQN